jgi:CRP-like cAMP-binding protein
MDARYEFLQRFYQKYWPELSGEHFLMLGDAHTLESFKKGTVLVEPGQVCDWIGILKSGIIRQYVVADEKEHVGQIYMPNQAVTDYSSYFPGKESRIYIDVVKDAELFIIRKKDVEKFIEIIPGYLMLMFNYLSLNFITNYDRTISLLLDSAESRYLKLIKERQDVVQQVPLYMVASYLGITPEALSRVRNKIAHSGA